MTAILSTSIQTLAHTRALLKWTLYKLVLADFFFQIKFFLSNAGYNLGTNSMIFPVISHTV